MKVNWLWDSRLGEHAARRILKSQVHPKFDLYAEKLFSRVSDPRVAFTFIDQVTFCKKWVSIKKRMRKDRWLASKVAFWQTIYERVRERFKEQGLAIRQSQAAEIPAERMQLAQQIRKIRVQLGYTQGDIAKKLGVIQQYISRIESGHENVSVDTLRRIAGALSRRLLIKLQ